MCRTRWFSGSIWSDNSVLQKSIQQENIKAYTGIKESVYTWLMHFPESSFSVQNFTSLKCFENVYDVTTAKLHLHHWHFTGRIYGFVHGFCKWKVRENLFTYAWRINSSVLIFSNTERYTFICLESKRHKYWRQ